MFAIGRDGAKGSAKDEIEDEVGEGETVIFSRIESGIWTDNGLLIPPEVDELFGGARDAMGRAGEEGRGHRGTEGATMRLPHGIGRKRDLTERYGACAEDE